MLSVKELRDKYDNDKIGNGSFDDKTLVGVRGRAMAIREQGKKLVFIDLVENDSRVQVQATAEFYQADLEYLKRAIRRGDLIGVVGHPGRANKGEFSVRANNIELLSYCMHQLPK